MKKTISLIALIAVFSATTVMAEGTGTVRDPKAAPGVDKRIVRQRKRISNKLQKGKITQDQANQLNKNVDAVQSNEQALAQDGKLTREERKSLHQQLNENSNTIRQTGAAGTSGK